MLGLGTTLQVVPSKCSMRVRVAACDGGATGVENPHSPNVVGSEREHSIELVGTVAYARSLRGCPPGSIEMHGQRAAVVILRPVESDGPYIVGGVGTGSHQEGVSGETRSEGPTGAVVMLEKKVEKLTAVGKQAADRPDVISRSGSHRINGGLISGGKLWSGKNAPLGAIPLFDDLIGGSGASADDAAGPGESGEMATTPFKALIWRCSAGVKALHLVPSKWDNDSPTAQISVGEEAEAANSPLLKLGSGVETTWKRVEAV